MINSSLAGVYKTARDRGARKVYGMLHGIQGLLQERYVDLSDHIKTDLDIELLKRTPSAYLGSCRFKLPEICEGQHPATVAPPGGETLNQVDERCRQAWDMIRSGMKGDTAVVAHGGTLAHFIVHLLEGQPEAKEIVVSNASITTMDYDPESGGLPPGGPE